MKKCAHELQSACLLSETTPFAALPVFTLIIIFPNNYTYQSNRYSGSRYI
jgi:hypothetical protein